MSAHSPFICRSCTAGCGMLALVSGDEVLKVSGDPAHPLSRGYTCPKGRDIPRMHHAPDRLVEPQVRGRAASWDAVLEDLSSLLSTSLDRWGADSVAGYAGTGMFTDSLGWWTQKRFLQHLGSSQNYTSSTVDISPLFKVNELVTGFGWVNPTWDPSDDAPGLVLMWGLNPAVSHGYFGAKLTNPGRQVRDFRARGGEIWVVDPRATKTAGMADRHLPIRPSSDVYILAWLLREILRSGANDDEISVSCVQDDVERLRAVVEPFTGELAAMHSGLRIEDLLDLLSAVRRRGQLAFLPGTGLGFGEHGTIAAWLGLALMIVTGSLDRPGGLLYNSGGLGGMTSDKPWDGHAPVDGHQQTGPRSRPELYRYLGEPPAVALVDEIEAGNVHALIIGGGNPLTAFPQPDRLRSALSALDALVLIDTHENALTRLATHVLPSTSQLERPDLQTHHRLQYTDAVVEPHPGRRPVWWIYNELARRTRGALFQPETSGARSGTVTTLQVMKQYAGDVYGGWDNLLLAGTLGVDVPRRTPGWIHENVLPGGRWRLAPAVLVDRLAELSPEVMHRPRLISGRMMESTNSVHSARPKASRRGTPSIHVSPDVARDAGVASGDEIEVTSRFGRMFGAAEVDPGLAECTVWAPHGWSEQPVNALVDGGQIDPLTGQPVMTGLEISIRRRGTE